MSLAGSFRPQASAGISKTGDVAPAARRGLHKYGRTRLVRWLLAPESNVSEAVHAALVADIDMSTNSMLTAIGSFFLFDGICYVLTREPVFLWMFVANIAVSGVRLVALWLVLRQGGPRRRWHTDFYTLSGLAWCLVQGSTTGVAIWSDVPAMQTIATGVAIAAHAAIAARNFGVPRLAMATIAALYLPFLFAAVFGPDHWMIALGLLAPGYVYGLVTTVRRFHKILVENYVAQFANRQQARSDPLTGMLNRLGMKEVLEQSEKLDGRLTLFLMDLDGFKQVNDGHGHAAGDLLLQMVAARLCEVARREDSLARLGGDEFALIAPGLPVGAAEAVAARIVAAVAGEPYALGEGILARVGVSVGYACAPEDARTLQELSELADAALYGVKQRGKGSWQRAFGAR